MAIFFLQQPWETSTESYLYLHYQDEEIEVKRGRVFSKGHSYPSAEMRFRSGPVLFWRLCLLCDVRTLPGAPQRDTPSGSQHKLGCIQMLSPYLWGCPLTGSEEGLRHLCFLIDIQEVCVPVWLWRMALKGGIFALTVLHECPLWKHRPRSTEGKNKGMNLTSKLKAELSIFFMGISPMLLCHKRVTRGRGDKYTGWF